MPTTGQKDAQGYTWNGGQWVSQDGYAKGSAEDKRKNQGWLSKAWGFGTDVVKDVASDLTKAETWANPAGSDATGFLRVVGGVNTLFNPISNFGAAKVDINKGNWKGALLNTGMGAAGLLGGAGTLRSFGKAGAAGAKGAGLLTDAYRIRNATKGAKVLTGLGAAGNVLGLAGILSSKPGQPTTSSNTSGRDMSMTPEQAARRAAAERNRTDAAGNSGMGGRNTVYTDGVRPPGGYPGAGAGTGSNSGAAAGAGKLGLLGLDPDQLAQTGEGLTSLEKMYQDALNQYTLAEQQGQQGYTQSVQGARRQATGVEQDLASQLAAAGLDISPSSAFAAGQVANAPRQAQETAARKTLDQLLAQITTGRTQARTKRDTDKLMINRLINDYRIKNTLAAQQAGYGAMGGY
jgi:hypothetical protein